MTRCGLLTACRSEEPHASNHGMTQTKCINKTPRSVRPDRLGVSVNKTPRSVRPDRLGVSVNKTPRSVRPDRLGVSVN